jgi:hypothetical protein
MRATPRGGLEAAMLKWIAAGCAALALLIVMTLAVLQYVIWRNAD